jgi:DNA gyrase subunit A
MGLSSNEQIVHLGTIDADDYLVMGTARGRAKRISHAVLEDELVEGVWAEIIGLSKRDHIAFAGTCGEDGRVLFFTDSRTLHTSASEISDQKTLTARGVAGIKLGKTDTLVGGSVLRDPKKCQVFVLSERGYLKRLSLSKFTLQSRAGKGMQSLKITKSTGPVDAATAGEVSQTTKVDVLAHDGKRQRIPLGSIPRARSGQSHGKKLVTIGPVSEIVLS